MAPRGAAWRPQTRRAPGALGPEPTRIGTALYGDDHGSGIWWWGVDDAEFRRRQRQIGRWGRFGAMLSTGIYTLEDVR